MSQYESADDVAAWARRVAPQRFMVSKEVHGPVVVRDRRYYNSREAAQRGAERMAKELAQWMDDWKESGILSYRVTGADAVIYEGVAWGADMRGFRRRWEEVDRVHVDAPQSEVEA